jgi:hypothetical protein
MREAIGSAFIVNLILIFIGIISAILVGSIGYSKAYKVKDKIIYIIEKYDGWSNDTQTEIDKSLRSIGYQVGSGTNFSCERIYRKKLGSAFKNENLVHGANLGYNQYNYCVYRNRYDSGIGDYYSVTTFMSFDIPFIGNFLQFPVSGETSVIFEPIDN